jgi:multimeric flavodoxin WrbA
MVRLDSLKFRHCEGYFSKSLRACTWPCSITQMDPTDQLDQVYEALVHWADAIIVATPIRWGAPSSLYFKMVERLNCVQVDVATKEQQIIMNKVAGFIIVGGQDNIQGVAGQMMSFFGELGFQFPKFPYIAHSRGWSHEDMENNVRIVRDSKALAAGAAALAERCLEMASKLVAAGEITKMSERGGLKGRPVMSARIDRD